MGSFVLELLRLSRGGEPPKMRLGACKLLGAYIAETKADFEPYATDIFSALLDRYNDPLEVVQKAAVTALQSVSDRLDKEKYSEYLELINVTLDVLSRYLASPLSPFSMINTTSAYSHLSPTFIVLCSLFMMHREVKSQQKDGLPGFAIKDGLNPVLPLYLDSLRIGSPVVRGHALEGIRLILVTTSAEALKAHFLTHLPLCPLLDDSLFAFIILFTTA